MNDGGKQTSDLEGELIKTVLKDREARGSSYTNRGSSYPYKETVNSYPYGNKVETGNSYPYENKVDPLGDGIVDPLVDGIVDPVTGEIQFRNDNVMLTDIYKRKDPDSVRLVDYFVKNFEVDIEELLKET